MANYSDYFKSLSKKGIKMMTYDAPTDEELYAKASLAAEEDYKSDFDRLFNQTKGKKDVMAQAIRNTESDYGTALQSLEKEYESASKLLSEEALARGLGRSSYALDLQSENLNEKQESLSALMADKMQAVNVIQNQIDLLEQEFIDNQTYLSGKKEDEIKSTLANLKAERDETIREVLEYNNELIMDQKEYDLKKLKTNRDYAAKLAKANKTTRTAPTTNTAPGSQATAESLMNAYTRLTGAEKLAFFNTNQEVMQSKLDMDTYKNILREIYAYVEQGVKPATSEV